MGAPPSSANRARMIFAVAVLPAVALLGLALLWPMLQILLTSLRPKGTDGLSLANYGDVLTDPLYRQSLLNTMQLALGSTALALLLCTPAALHLSDHPSRLFTSFADALLAFPLSLPGIVVGFFAIILLGGTGLIPKGLEAVTGERSLDIAYDFSGIMLAYLYFQVPRVIGTLRGAVDQLDLEMIDVARTLGASPSRVTWTVIVPALRPALVAAGGLALATGVGAFGTAATLSQGFRVLALDLGDAVTTLRTDLASAMAIILATVTLAIFILGDHLVQRWESSHR